MKHWGHYVLTLIVLAACWEICKAMVYISAESARIPAKYYNHNQEPLLRITGRFIFWKWFAPLVTILLILYISIFGTVLPVLLTGDFNAQLTPQSGPLASSREIIMFFLGLFFIIFGTFHLGLFFSTKVVIVMILQHPMRTLLFFNSHMEVRTFLWKRQIYPYNAVEVVVRASESARYIGVIRPSSKNVRLGSVTMHSDQIGMERITQAEHFLAERVQNFRREEEKINYTGIERQVWSYWWLLYIILGVISVALLFLLK